MSEKVAVITPIEQLFWCNLGKRLKRAREARGWARAAVIARLPTPVVNRSLEAYESGDRRLLVSRYVELCAALNESPGEMLDAAVKETRNFSLVSMKVDLVAISRDREAGHSQLCEWAKNHLKKSPDEKVIVLMPVVVETLATMLGCTSRELVKYLSGFIVLRAGEGVG